MAAIDAVAEEIPATAVADRAIRATAVIADDFPHRGGTFATGDGRCSVPEAVVDSTAATGEFRETDAGTAVVDRAAAIERATLKVGAAGAVAAFKTDCAATVAARCLTLGAAATDSVCARLARGAAGAVAARLPFLATLCVVPLAAGRSEWAAEFGVRRGKGCRRTAETGDADAIAALATAATLIADATEASATGTVDADAGLAIGACDALSVGTDVAGWDVAARLPIPGRPITGKVHARSALRATVVITACGAWPTGAAAAEPARAGRVFGFGDALPVGADVAARPAAVLSLRVEVGLARTVDTPLALRAIGIVAAGVRRDAAVVRAAAVTLRTTRFAGVVPAGGRSA